ncbi:hypothetical protein RUM43_013363 [Polyplax serrata]|uniref:Uncharacterized protein n=1 Tax=Polyplax serrata TaxID=468196 RepID=A0AAN8RY99_POLSC
MTDRESDNDSIRELVRGCAYRVLQCMTRVEIIAETAAKDATLKNISASGQVAVVIGKKGILRYTVVRSFGDPHITNEISPHKILKLGHIYCGWFPISPDEDGTINIQN